jgi:nicotinate-nucleotide adenylyltransferase
VVAAAGVRHALALDVVLAVPAADPWQKRGSRPISPAEVRLAMTRAAFAGIDGVEVSTIEIDRGGESATADTLEQLHATCPDDDVWLIVGSDVAALLDTWRRPEDVRSGAHLVVYERPGALSARPPAGWPFELVQVPHLDVSSTAVRGRVRRGEPIDGLVPPAVVALVRAHRLYQEAA